MTWDTPEMIECRRLIRKFFPESRSTVFLDRPMYVSALIDAMWSVPHWVDCSCDPCPYIPGENDLGLASSGGVWDDDVAIYKRLLAHTGFAPTGRVVIMPDDYGAWEREPIICHSRTACDRIREFEQCYTGSSPCRLFFDGMSDIVFVYESGEAMVLDHEQRLFWAVSVARRSEAGIEVHG